MENRIKATLRLENGMTFEGYSFGCKGAVSGEVVFSTAMTGYPEQLSDPTYYGQILCLTYPLIGNYGVPSEETVLGDISRNLESGRIQPAGLVVFDYCEDYSNWEADKSLEQWMNEQGLVGIMGIDTREVAKFVRDSKTPVKGWIVTEGETEKDAEKEVFGPADVSCKEPEAYQHEDVEDAAVCKKVVLVDCGVKHSIIRDLFDRGVDVIRVPYNYDFTDLEYDGIFVSNGPGDPENCAETAAILKKAMEAGKPMFGYGLGYLLMAKAAGCATARLERAHRSANQPVRQNGTNRAYITSQNAGYTVVESSVPSDWFVLFRNLNDNTVDGICHRTQPFAGMQFNPSVCVRKDDDSTLFTEFISKL